MLSMLGPACLVLILSRLLALMLAGRPRSVPVACRTLVNLDLASNGLQQDTCAVLQHVLPSGALQTLSVAANPLGRQVGPHPTA